MGNVDSKFLDVYTVNMGPRHKNQSETAREWTTFRKEYLNKFLTSASPDIVFVQEGTVNLLNGDNLLLYDKFPESGPTGIIIKKSIPCKQMEKDIFPVNTRNRIEGITIDYQNISLCFASFHGETVKRKQGTKSEEKRIWNNLRDLICTLDKLRKESLIPIVVGGDFNLDVDLVRKAVEGIKNSSLMVKSAEIAEEATDHDYDFFIITYDLKCECRKERRNRFFPRDNTLSTYENPIVDHSPTRMLVHPSKIFEKTSTEAIIDSLKKEVHDLKEEMETLLDKRKDQLRLLKEFANECHSENFEVVVNIDFEEFREIPEPEDDGLIGYRQVLFLMTQAKSYEGNKETLTQMDFKIKAPLEESDEHGDKHTKEQKKGHKEKQEGATGGKKLAVKEKKNPTGSPPELVYDRGSHGKSKRKETSAELNQSPAAPSTSGYDAVAQGEHVGNAKSMKKHTKGQKKDLEEKHEDLATGGKELPEEEKKDPTASGEEEIERRVRDMNLSKKTMQFSETAD